MESKTAVAALSALAQENRLDVFRLLVQAGAAGLRLQILQRQPIAVAAGHLEDRIDAALHEKVRRGEAGEVHLGAGAVPRARPCSTA